jgi:sugar phosphate isomerase/epimerase
MPTRRDFVATIAAVAGGAIGRAAVAPFPTSFASSPLSRKLDRIGIQLYAVRTEMQRDFTGTLERIAGIGYQEVEFAGFYDRKPADIRLLLQRLNLTAPSAHLGFDILKAGTDQALAAVAELGAKYATVAWTPPEDRGGTDAWKRVADLFNAAGRKAQSHGLRFAYHNHDFEFEPCVGQTFGMDTLLANTDPALVWYEMDVYWVTAGGQDPLAYIRKYPSRFVMFHIKDSAGPPDHKQTDVGAGTIDFAAVLRANPALQHAFVESDEPADPLGFARNSFNYLKGLEY